MSLNAASKCKQRESRITTKQLIEEAHKHLESYLTLQQLMLARIANSFHLNGLCLKNHGKTDKVQKNQLAIFRYKLLIKFATCSEQTASEITNIA